MRKTPICSLVAIATVHLLVASLAEAEEGAPAPTEKVAASDQPAAAPVPPAPVPAPAAAPIAAPAAPKATAVRQPSPVYVANWDQLAELTQADLVVGPKTEAHGQQRYAAQVLAIIGLVGGGAAAGMGTTMRLSDDRWTRESKLCLAGGLSFAAVTLFISWVMAPDRDDFYTVINTWNLRHPDRPLAP